MKSNPLYPATSTMAGLFEKMAVPNATPPLSNVLFTLLAHSIAITSFGAIFGSC
jgi:hypothetical protein